MPIHSHLLVQNDITTSHNNLIIGTFNQISDSTLATQLDIPLDVWAFVLKELQQQTGIQVYVKERAVCFALLPYKHSRHNSWTHADKVTSICKRHCQSGDWNILLLSDERSVDAHIGAVAKAFPSFTTKTSPSVERLIHIIPLGHTASPNQQILVDNIRLCGHLVDQPPSHCHISNLIQYIQEWAKHHPNVSVKIIRGQKLQDKGLNGLWSVGKAAEEEPALVCLHWNPSGNNQGMHICWIGKGIIYDTGGLSLKSKTGMPGMKTDMAGAAAVFTGFKTAVEQAYANPLSAVLCLAENAIGPHALRNDDIITMYSGKTVEVNNTDAEGRLVLADGAAWAERNLQPAVLIDMATLTGAASTTVGRGISALYCNDEDLESIAIQSGLITGEVCYPLPYIPENWKLEFSSSVADMRNSVARRNNAQSACAGQFIGNHLTQQTPWLHIDIAPAAIDQGRGTAVGVQLLLQTSTLYCKYSI